LLAPPMPKERFIDLLNVRLNRSKPQASAGTRGGEVGQVA